MNEGKKDRRDPIRTVKPRNFVAKNASATTSGAGAHKDKKKAAKQGEVKHKNKEYAEGLQTKLNVALAEAGSPAQQAAIAINMKKHHQKPKSEDVDQDEYSDEAGMSYGSLHTIARAATGLLDTIKEGDDLPEWCQEKISLAEDYLVTVWDYLQSEKEQGVAEGGYNDYDNNRKGFSRPGREDDEYHVPDPDPEFQRNRQETMMYNVTVGGKPMTEKPFLGRSAALAWAKQQVNAGTLDAKEAKLSPVQYNEGAKVDRQAKHITASMMKKGKSKKDAEAIAWAHIKHPKKKKAEGWTHDTLADQLFEHERTYEEQLQNKLNKQLGR
jgi:hypothetical protein